MEFDRIRFARTMNERCGILRDKLGGKFYASVSEYEGYGFLNAWDWKVDGEVGWLLTPEETSKQWREGGRRSSCDGEMKKEDDYASSTGG